MADQVSVSQEIDAPAERVWAMVSDVTQMGRWSPENDGATWLRGAKGPQSGAMFRGMNHNGKKKWKSVGTIIDAELGRLLMGPKVAEWRYEFETTASGCQVTETWMDQRGPIVKALGKPVTGVQDRTSRNRVTMDQTLENLKSAAESATASN